MGVYMETTLVPTVGGLQRTRWVKGKTPLRDVAWKNFPVRACSSAEPASWALSAHGGRSEKGRWQRKSAGRQATREPGRPVTGGSAGCRSRVRGLRSLVVAARPAEVDDRGEDHDAGGEHDQASDVARISRFTPSAGRPGDDRAVDGRGVCARPRIRDGRQQQEDARHEDGGCEGLQPPREAGTV